MWVLVPTNSKYVLLASFPIVMIISLYHTPRNIVRALRTSGAAKPGVPMAVLWIPAGHAMPKSVSWKRPRLSTLSWRTRRPRKMNYFQTPSGTLFPVCGESA